MPYNGSGAFAVYTPGTPYVTGTTISSTVANNVNTDFATGLSTAIAKDGQTTTTASIPFAVGIGVTTGITTPSTTFALVNTTATTVNFAGAATTINVGAATGTTTFTSATQSTNTSTGAIITNGGLGVAKNVNFGAALNVTGVTSFLNTTDAGNFSAASVVLAGGLGVAKSVRVQTGYQFTIGVYALRSSTEPTNAINLYDGTAPVGTMTNGVTLYSTAGKLWAMDAAGNATKLTP